MDEAQHIGLQAWIQDGGHQSVPGDGDGRNIGGRNDSGGTIRVEEGRVVVVVGARVFLNRSRVTWW